MVHVLDNLDGISADITRDPVSHKDEFAPSDIVQTKYREMRNRVFDFSLKNTLSVLGSGIGKGMLVLAGVAIIGSAMVVGGLAASGAIEGLTGVGGILNGGAMGASFLGSNAGIAALAGFGAVGAYSSYQDHQHTLQEASAKAEERKAHQEYIRDIAKGNDPEQAQATEREAAAAEGREATPSFTDRYGAKKRNNPGQYAKNNYVPVTDEPLSHAVRELERRAENHLPAVMQGISYV